MSKKKNEEEQKARAYLLFKWLVGILVVGILLLLAIQYHWFGWFPDRKPAAYDPIDPLTWALAALIGASLYLMGQIATYFPKINEKPDPDNQNDFVRSTYWYATTLLRAPVLTVVIMWLLMNLTVGLGEATGGNSNPAGEGLGLSLDFSKFPDIVNLGIAFILGFYGRVARKQLDVIAKYLFTKAWALAELGFDITVPDDLLLGETHTFKTEPKMDVVWSANPGSMGADSGVYTAPSKFEGDARQVVILAYLRSEPSATYVKQIPLKLFRITSSTKEAAPNEEVTLTLDKKLEKFDDKEFKLAEAVWNSTDAALNIKNTKGESLTFKVPEKEKEGKVFTITATCLEQTAEFKLTVVKAE